MCTRLLSGGATGRLRSLALKSQLRKNLASGVPAAVIQAAANLVTYPAYLHYLGYEQYGIWLTVATVITVTQLSSAGLGPAVTQLVAQARGGGRTQAATSYLTWGTLLSVAISLALFACALCFRDGVVRWMSLAPSVAGIASRLLPPVALLAGYVLVTECYTATIAGLGRQDIGNLSTASAQAATAILAIALLSWGYGIYGLLWSTLIVKLGQHLYLGYAIRAGVGVSLFSVRSAKLKHLYELGRLGGPIVSGTLLNMLLAPFSKLVIARYISIAQVPVYEISWGVAMQGRNLVEYAVRGLMPEFSRLSAAGDRRSMERIRRLYRKGEYLALGAGVPLFLAILLVAPQFLARWLHAPAADGYMPVMRIILLGALANLLAVPSYYLAVGLGHSLSLTMCYGIQAGVNAGVMAILLHVQPRFSVVSVAAATAGGLVCAAGYLAFSARRLLAGRDRRVARMAADCLT